MGFWLLDVGCWLLAFDHGLLDSSTKVDDESSTFAIAVISV
jgi:hypothetical protein